MSPFCSKQRGTSAPALFSQNDVLSVQFSWQTTTDSAGRTLYCFMTPSGLENPTLHLKPGDHLIVTVTNNTPALGFMMSLDPPLCGPGGSEMTFSSVNIHYHGTLFPAEQPTLPAANANKFESMSAAEIEQLSRKALARWNTGDSTKP